MNEKFGRRILSPITEKKDENLIYSLALFLFVIAVCSTPQRKAHRVLRIEQSVKSRTWHMHGKGVHFAELKIA